MRIRRLISLLVLPLALAACDDSTAPAPPPEIVGSWTRASEPATANVADHLGFGADGRYVHDVMIYQDAGHGTLSSSYREEGSYRLNGERLELRVTRTTEWDALIGGVPVVTNGPGTWADAGIVRISGNTLDHTYVTYPAEAPVETTARYFKALLD